MPRGVDVLLATRSRTPFAFSAELDAGEDVATLATIRRGIAYLARRVHAGSSMYGRILRQLREAKGRSQADVARKVGISPAQLARLEANQRGLYVEDFVAIADVLGEKPGNLLPNDLGEIGHLKPLIDQLTKVRPEFLARITAIVGRIALLTEDVALAKRLAPAPSLPRTSRQPSRKTASRKRRR